jgi:hypothetical protein
VILVYCPLSPVGIYPETRDSIFGLDWSGPVDVMFGREDNPLEDKLHNVADKYEHARSLALAGGYEAMMTVEYDIILPKDALVRLTRVSADIAYGLVVSRVNKQWYLYSDGPTRGKQASRNRKFRSDAWGNVVPSVGIGNGATLIHRNVLERLQFYCKPGVFQDWNFSHDAQKNGFIQMHDCGVVCGHILENGDVLYPDPDKTWRIA